MKKYRLGPLFTPPSLEGTLGRPGHHRWSELGRRRVRSRNRDAVREDHQLARDFSRESGSLGGKTRAEVDADWSGDLGAQATFHGRLPLTKPPYGHLTAIDLNHGTIAWHEPFGDWPELRSNPALKGVKLPEKLGIAGPQSAIVTKGGVVFVGGEDMNLHAVDKSTGKDLWQGALPARSYGDADDVSNARRPSDGSDRGRPGRKRRARRICVIRERNAEMQRRRFRSNESWPFCGSDAARFQYAAEPGAMRS